MNATRFDTIAKLFATRRLSRRQAMRQGGTGLAAAALAAAGLAPVTGAQNAAQAAPAAGEDGPVFLFLQAFQAGSVTPKEDAPGRYVLTLESGLGHTVYFSDRPERIVGATPTPQFLRGLGFPDDNPPNAALIVESAPGETEVAVLQLFSPAYEEATHTATYEVAVLAEWERTPEEDFAETAVELDQVLPEFGAAHLFIDDCPDGTVACVDSGGNTFYPHTAGFCWDWGDACCRPCQDAATYCNDRFGISGCGGTCTAASEVEWYGCAS